MINPFHLHPVLFFFFFVILVYLQSVQVHLANEVINRPSSTPPLQIGAAPRVAGGTMTY
jgi:hypothetical protein